MGKQGKKKPLRRAVPGPQIKRPAGISAPAGAGPEADLRRGLAAFQQGDYAAAIQAWKQARRGGAPAAVERALAEAQFRRALGTPNPARRAQELQEVVALAPQKAIYQLHLGLAYQQQGQTRRALTALQEAHRLAPGDERIRRHLALCLLSDPAGASQARQALAGAPANDEAAARLRALAHLYENNPAAALPSLAACKAPSPLATLAAGLAQLAAGQLEAGQASLAKVQRSRRPLPAEARQAAAVAGVVAQTRTGDLNGALKTLRKLGPPENPALRRAFARAAHRLAVELVLGERTDEAIEAWRSVLKAEPDNTVARRCLGHLREVAATAAVRRGDFDAAVDHWRSVVAGEPENTRALRNLALTEERLQNWQLAGADWEELTRRWRKELQALPRQSAAAGELRHRLAAAYRHLAGTHRAAGDPNAAARTLERALGFDPSDVDLRLLAAELYMDREQWGNAIDHLRRAASARPNDAHILLELGQAYDLKGEFRQALGYLQQALALEPENPAIKGTLASVHHGQGHRLRDSKLFEQAVAEFERAAQLAPHDHEHSVCLGETHLRLGRLAPAQSAFRRALALRPGDGKLRGRIGAIYLDQNQEKEAERLFRQALRLERGPAMHAAIGLSYLRHGDAAKAAPHLKHVLKGREPITMTLVGRVLIDARREAEAIPYLERAVSLAPWLTDAHFDLALAYISGARDYVRAAAELSLAEALALLSGDRQILRLIATVRERLEWAGEDAAFTGPTGPPKGL